MKTCMIDVLGRCGRVEDAEAYMHQHGLNHDQVCLSTVMGACRIHRNLNVAERVFSLMKKFTSSSSATHVAMLHIYAKHGEWDKRSALMSDMKELNIKRTPGVSYVEVDGIAHRFSVSDTSFEHHEQVYSFLRHLRERITDKLGYKPDLTCVTRYFESDHDKIQHLWEHSEKIALGYALMNTKPEDHIVITNNLRICEDCHHAMELISREYSGRMIQVRDANRFHHFKDGSCSCGNKY
ncbi:hypothetical protein AKO1_008111 [Acrasis kona]|uniref:DYW domain-containing protein n=1 Tax=Acrasis kona TaxID=1008807 RepID=A0AAW2YQU4_9EUKA